MHSHRNVNQHLQVMSIDIILNGGKQKLLFRNTYLKIPVVIVII